MIISPNGHELVTRKKDGSKGTVEHAMAVGFEDAIKDKDRECDYEFTIEDKNDVKHILCEVKLDSGYYIDFKHPVNEKQNLSEIERDAYKFLLEKL